jgi:hypothetical protein
MKAPPGRRARGLERGAAVAAAILALPLLSCAGKPTPEAAAFEKRIANGLDEVERATAPLDAELARAAGGPVRRMALSAVGSETGTAAHWARERAKDFEVPALPLARELQAEYLAYLTNQQQLDQERGKAFELIFSVPPSKELTGEQEDQLAVLVKGIRRQHEAALARLEQQREAFLDANPAP